MFPIDSERFFKKEDFDCVSLENARSEDPLVVAARKKVVEKLHKLHEDYLGDQMKQYGLKRFRPV
ncbi:MAG: hypothetical protein PHO01_02820 [Desulfotomaculaceae bacterium]|nr:hypothetical protein [Desulfotomaculaceae bacterium]